MPWFIWLFIAALALAGETVSTAFVLLYIGLAAAVTAVFAALGMPFALQLVIFIPLTLALLSLVRPRTLALLHGSAPKRQISAHARMVDRMAMVEHEVTDESGMVRLGSGEFWTARAYPPGVTISKGTSVRIMFVEGLTVHVSIPTESGTLPDLPLDISARPADVEKEGA